MAGEANKAERKKRSKKLTVNQENKNRLQVMVEPWTANMVLKIMESEGRNQSDVLRILIEIGLYTLLDNPKEIERRLRRLRGTDKNTLLVYLQQLTEN